MLELLDDASLVVIVFGPGFGESIAIRVPPDTWIVVDGCKTGEVSPAAQLLADHHKSWSCVVLTHRHEDHSIGLDDVLAQDGTGPIGCAAPLIDDPENWTKSDDAEFHLIKGTTEHVLATINDRWRANPSTRWELSKGSVQTVGDAVLTSLWPDATALSEYRSVDTNSLSSPLLVRWK